MSLAPRSRVTTLVTLVAALVVGLTAVATGVSRSADVAAKVTAAVSAEAACPPGTQPLGNERETLIDQTGAAARYRGGLGASPNELSYGLYSDCAPIDRPESFQELAVRDAQQSGIRSAPFDDVPGEALLAAVDQRQALVGRAVANSGGSMTKYGTGPLNFDDPRFDEVNGQGIVDSTGRVDGFHHDPQTGLLFTAVGTGGIWLSRDLGETFRPISDTLPTQVVGDVSYTAPNAQFPDGVVHVVTGEHTFGGGAYLGLGVFRSTDLGATWQRSTGPNSGTLGFAIEVDPTNPTTVYAATGNGLWRSTDAGATYTDVVLPTGDCAGDYNNETCNFANFVTDVVVQTPGGTSEVAGGRVVAAVGWRAGMAENPNGTVQSTHNGVYRSEDGSPGSFERLDGLDSAVGGRERIARTEFGPTVGPAQDHDYLYAIVEDAVLFNGGSPVLDGALVGDDTGKMISGTVISGVYVSPDFGASWTLLADDNELAQTCPVNRSVYCVPGLGVTPGVQSWYNMWIQPDPTRADPATNAPTRVLFGLEEVWQNRGTATPTPVTNNDTSFEVIGSYYGELGCLVGQCVIGSAPTGPAITTTHPDQHAGIIIPLEGGGAKLVVGHDGGVSSQTVDAQPATDTEFTQFTWDLEQENGLQTLLPYSAVWANDGVAWAGLQDNGHMRVAPEELGGEPTADGKLNQFETFGADGTFAAVDPTNSDYAVESTQNAGMHVTVDGGETWARMNMPASNVRFVNPFVMDPLDSNHIVSGGKEIVETLVGPETAGGDWIQVFDLGTADTEPRVETTRPQPAFQQSAIDTRGDTTYVGFCGVCDVLNSPYPFRNGIATNVNGFEAPEKGTEKGWHKTAAEGLPNRFITSVAIDPQDASQRTVYVTLGGYSRSWVPPGTAGDTAEDVGEGHVYKSTDAGETFVDISGDLPDTPALWVEPRGGQLLVGTDVGPFISSDTSTGADWAVLGAGELPAVPITSIQLKPNDPDQALIGTYGRGLWRYEFPDEPFDGVDTPTGEVPGLELDRVAGGDRIATAIEVSKDTRDSADTIAIARADLYADALAGSTIAFREDAPLLLSRTTDLPSEVADEIERLGATTAIVLGGDTALNPAVIDGLREAGITEFDRYAGADRFQTAGLIAEEIGGENVWVTEGTDPDPTRGWPDAMSIAPVAAVQQRPILLVATDSIPAATTEALDELGITGARIVGGPVAVSEQVEDELADQVKVGDRVAGGTRYGTSVEAAKVGIASGLRDASIWLARGGNFPDALAAGPTVAADGGVLLLVDETDLDESPETRDFLEERVCNVRTLRVLGGEQAIEADVLAAVGDIFVDRDCGADSPGGDSGADNGGVPTPPTPNPQASGESPPPAPDTVAFGPFDFEADAQGWTTSTADPFSAFTRGGPGHESDTAFRIDMYRDEANATLTSPTVEGAGGDARIDFWAAYNIEGGGFDELQVGIVPDGGDFQPLATLGGESNGYPAFSNVAVDFTEPNGPYQIEFLFYSDEICSGLVTDDGEVLCGGAYDSLGVDDVTLLR